MKISASIYSDKKRPLKKTVEDLKAHQVDYLHVDCNDDLTVLEDIKQLREWCDLPIDLHIISNEPEKFYSGINQLKIEFVTFQHEELPKDFVFPELPSSKLGLAIVTPTSVDVFDHYQGLDFILLMATIPGQSGGKFNADNFRKIREFKKRYPKKQLHVDGGVNGEVSFILRNMGVHASVSGSFLFNAPSIGQALMDLTKREVQSAFKIKDFMIPRAECPVIDRKKLSLESALRSIDEGKLGFAIVKHDAKFDGIISNADIRKTLLKHIDQLPLLPAEEMINKNPIFIREDRNVNDMLRLVREQAFPISYLPVINKDKEPTGIVTFVNLVKGEF